LGLPAPAAAQDTEVQRLDQFFNGKQYHVSWREGGPIYGTYFFLRIHYCPNGQYMLVGRSVKQTVMDNEQISNWEESGRWQATRLQGQLGVRYQPLGGSPNFVPVRLLPNGGIWVNDELEILPRGQAQC
jgi:hypothetical protein